MPINVNGTELIQDDGTVVNFTDLSGEYSSLYPNFKELPNPDPSVPDNVIDCNYSLHYVTPAVNNYPYQFQNQALGDIITVVVDRGADGASGNDPVFGEYSHAGGGSGYTMWSSTGVPTWANHRYWMLTFFAVGFGSNLLMRGVAVGYDGPTAGGNTIPFTSSNFTGRQSSAGIVAFVSDADIDAGSAFALATVRLKFYGDTTTDTFYATVSRINGSTGNWYNAAGSSSALGASEVTIFSKSGIKPTGIRVVYGTSSNPTSNDSGWNNISNGNVGTTTVDCSSSASATGSNINSDSDDRVITIYGRAAGYDDTAFGTFEINSSAIAEANCFTGESLLYLLDSNDRVKTMKMEEAYEAYYAVKATSQPVKMIVLGVDGYFNEVLDFRKTIGRTSLYGINSEESFVTGGHPFLTTHGWKCMNVELGKKIRPDLELSELMVGDVLIKIDPITQEKYQEIIETITRHDNVPAAVYSLDVAGPDSGTDGNDTYIVDGYVVHNK